MKTLIIFNNLNDIVYLNCCLKFVQHVERLAASRGLLTSTSKSSASNDNGKPTIDPNIIIQLFSPLVTSHRFMKEQFGNPYSSVQCEDGTNIVFQDYMGFLFLKIGNDDVQFLRRCLGICIEFVTYICGPDVSVLKTSNYHSEFLDQMLGTWGRLYSSDQSFLVEAVEQMLLNIQLSSALIKSLEQAAVKVRSYGTDHVHAILFLETKLLSWYSTRRSFHLTAQDLLFLITLCQKSWPHHSAAYQTHRRRREINSQTVVKALQDSAGLATFSSSEECSSLDEDEDSFCSSLSHLDSEEEVNPLEIEDEVKASGPGHAHSRVITDFTILKHYFVLFKNGISFVPHRVHIGIIQPGLYLVLVCESSSSSLTSQVGTSIQLVNEFQESKRDLIKDKHYFDILESSTKKVLEFLKKHKNAILRTDLLGRWDKFKIGFQQYIKSKDPLSLQLSPLSDIFREAFRAYFNEKEILKGIPETVLKTIWSQIQNETTDFWDFLKVKSIRNTTMGTRENLAINKYLEEFPGLVHFIYIDRNEHWVTTPALDFAKDDIVRLTRKKIWSMVKFAHEHMQHGNFSLMWKDSAFNYAYFLWFEDASGQAIRSKTQAALPWEGYPIPGILCGDFYKQLVDECFPSSIHSSSRMRCLELFCIHLGLVTSSCVLEHSKRLATTISEVTGTSSTAEFL